jgi:putative sterol carrier protein
MATFGTIEVYEEMAKLLNSDPVWADKGKAISYSMIYVYGPPVDEAPADFVLMGSPEVWRGVLDQSLNPTAALTRGQLKVKGKMTTLLKHMNAFSYVIDAMTKIELT